MKKLSLAAVAATMMIASPFAGSYAYAGSQTAKACCCAKCACDNCQCSESCADACGSGSGCACKK